MSGFGEFSTHARDGAHVTKRLNPRHPAGRRFVTAVAHAGETGMRSYLDALRSAGVTLPDELELVVGNPLTIRHRWVRGPSLLEAGNTEPSVFSTAIAQIGQWVLAVDNADARIDTNLANFCLAGTQPVLVDVLPPLIPSLRPTTESLFDELFSALCFDTPVILDALIGYALRALLCAGNYATARVLIPIARELTQHRDDCNGFPATWFRARRTLAMRAVEGGSDMEEVRDFFALSSVLSFRQLDEIGRRQRVVQVSQRIQELTYE